MKITVKNGNTVVFNGTATSIDLSDAVVPGPKPKPRPKPKPPVNTRGTINTKVNGQFYNVYIQAGQTHVYRVLGGRRNYTKFSFRYSTADLTVSMSQSPSIKSKRKNCTKHLGGSAAIYMNAAKVWGQCNQPVDKDIYLILTANKTGTYSFFW